MSHNPPGGFWQQQIPLFQYWTHELYGVALPQLRELHKQAPRAECPGFRASYHIVPRLKNVLAHSLFQEEEAQRFLRKREFKGKFRELQLLLSWVAGEMERYSRDYFEASIDRLSEDGVYNLIQTLTSQHTELNDPVLQFERIPEVSLEIQRSGIGSQSTVMVLGAGTLSLSGLAFAAAGAQVYLIDWDAVALESFTRMRNVLPDSLKGSFHCITADGASVGFAQYQPSHILVAGLIQGKERVLRSISAASNHSAWRPVILLRQPQPNLCRVFYYEVSDAALRLFEVLDCIHIGLEGFTDTLILQPQLLDLKE